MATTIFTETVIFPMPYSTFVTAVLPLKFKTAI